MSGFGIESLLVVGRAISMGHLTDFYLEEEDMNELVRLFSNQQSSDERCFMASSPYFAFVGTNEILCTKEH